MRTLRPSTVAPVAALALALTLSACGDGSASAGSGSATGDKKLTVYSGRSESLVKPVLDRFSTESGIAVEVRYGNTSQLAAQLLEEGGRTTADVFLAQDAGALGAVAKKGMFATLPAQTLDKVAARYRSRSGQWVGVTGRARTLVYNPDLVPAADLPKSVFELTDKKWAGKLGLAPTNASFQAFVTAVRVTQGDAKATELLNGLKANDPQIRENNDQIVLDVAAGKLQAGLVNHYYVHEIAKEKGVAPENLGAKLHFFAAGDLGNLVNVSGVGILSRAGSDADARALVDYLLGTEAQTHFATEVWEYPLIAGVGQAAGLPAFGSLEPPDVDLNDLDSLEQTVALIKESGLAA